MEYLEQLQLDVDDPLYPYYGDYYCDVQNEQDPIVPNTSTQDSLLGVSVLDDPLDFENTNNDLDFPSRPELATDALNSNFHSFENTNWDFELLLQQPLSALGPALDALDSNFLITRNSLLDAGSDGTIQILSPPIIPPNLTINGKRTLDITTNVEDEIHELIQKKRKRSIYTNEAFSNWKIRLRAYYDFSQDNDPPFEVKVQLAESLEIGFNNVDEWYRRKRGAASTGSVGQVNTGTLEGWERDMLENRVNINQATAGHMKRGVSAFTRDLGQAMVGIENMGMNKLKFTGNLNPTIVENINLDLSQFAREPIDQPTTGTMNYKLSNSIENPSPAGPNNPVGDDQWKFQQESESFTITPFTPRPDHNSLLSLPSPTSLLSLPYPTPQRCFVSPKPHLSSSSYTSSTYIHSYPTPQSSPLQTLKPPPLQPPTSLPTTSKSSKPTYPCTARHCRIESPNRGAWERHEREVHWPEHMYICLFCVFVFTPISTPNSPSTSPSIPTSPSDSGAPSINISCRICNQSLENLEAGKQHIISCIDTPETHETHSQNKNGPCHPTNRKKRTRGLYWKRPKDLHQHLMKNHAETHPNKHPSKHPQLHKSPTTAKTTRIYEPEVSHLKKPHVQLVQEWKFPIPSQFPRVCHVDECTDRFETLKERAGHLVAVHAMEDWLVVDDVGQK